MDVICDFGLLNKPDDVATQFLGQLPGIPPGDVAALHRISQGRLEITTFPFTDLLRHPPDAFILCTEFAPDRHEWAAKQAPVFVLLLCLRASYVLKVFLQAIYGRPLRRKDSIQVTSDLIPMVLVGSNGQLGLGSKKMVKTPFFDSRLLADVIDSDRTVALAPDQFVSRLQQSEF